LTEEALARAFTSKTEVVLFNNPLNPTATVFPAEDLALLAEFCVRFDAIAVCDEVWEHVIFDGRRHQPLIGLPAMRERTVKIGSAGKIFNLTGWKVGLVCADAAIMRVLAKAHQYITFTTPPNLQAAVAYGLMKDDAYFETLRADLQRSRDRFTTGLTKLGFDVLPSEATYFLNIDIGSLTEADDFTFCQRLVVDHGVAAIPVSAFYAERAVRNLVRFCFAKRDATLDAALERLAGVARKAA
jgi:aspartate/methionine/tyrosine aminotransferase